MGRPILFLIGAMFIVFGIILNSVNNRNVTLPQRSVEFYSELHAKNSVNSVMDYALHEIYNDQGWNDGYTNSEFLGANVTVEVFDQNSSDKPANHINNWNEYTLLLYGTAEYEGFRSTSEVYLEKDSYSRYSYFTETEERADGSNVWFIWSDVLRGPVHTNGVFHIAGAASFYGPGMVTSPNMWVGYPGFTDEPDFFGGSNFNAPEVDFPEASTIVPTVNKANSGGLTFTEEVYLEFLSDGNLLVRSTPNNDGPDNPNNDIVDMDLYNGVISSTEPIYVKGNINGNYTVHSSQDIIVNGDLIYEEDPDDSSIKKGLLGLVSEKDVVVSETAHQANGTQDLTIHASILAMDRSFRVENYNSGGSKGTLHLLGGIVQYERGAVGTFSGGQITNGFAKDYIYDERLLSTNPPGFPRKNTFSVRHWLTNTAYIGHN